MINKNIAIDGPAGAGKSTIAKNIAKKLQIVYVDTGAMYRAVALYFIRHNINTKSQEEIKKACDSLEITIDYKNEEQQVVLNNENVTNLLRKEEVGKMASSVAKHYEVRKKMVELQQNLAKIRTVIMDGRDIGTVVLPDAGLKIYLTASSGERAKRRQNELRLKGIPCNIDEIEQDIIARDKQDMNREISPLCQAEDAVLVDSSHMNIEEVIDTIIALYRERLEIG
jgi:cytidylate kinase